MLWIWLFFWRSENKWMGGERKLVTNMTFPFLKLTKKKKHNNVFFFSLGKENVCCSVKHRLEWTFMNANFFWRSSIHGFQGLNENMISLPNWKLPQPFDLNLSWNPIWNPSPLLLLIFSSVGKLLLVMLLLIIQKSFRFVCQTQEPRA